MILLLQAEEIPIYNSSYKKVVAKYNPYISLQPLVLLVQTNYVDMNISNFRIILH